MTQTLPLFDDFRLDAPATEGIKYVGSKLKLIPDILHLAAKVKAKTVLDGFSGTTRVAQALAKSGYTFLCNDIAPWSEIFGRCYLLSENRQEAYQPLIEHLNAIPPVDGWFTEHYGGHPNGGCAMQEDGLKRPWQLHNTRKLDAVRQEIERLNLNAVDKAVALTSLILALDKVDNSLGHFSAYLREWAPRSYREFVMKVPNLVRADSHLLGNRRLTCATGKHQVFRSDIFELAPRVTVDIAYFDPPYGSSNDKMPASRVRYAAYYHLWQSVVLFDRPPLFGKARRRKDTSDTVSASVFEEFRRNREGRFIAVDAIDKLIQVTQARWILLSYSSGGRATAKELNEVIQKHGKLLDVVARNYKKNVMASMKWTHEWVSASERPNREFLFLIQKREVS